MIPKASARTSAWRTSRNSLSKYHVAAASDHSQPHQARRNVGFQSNQLVSQIGQPPLLLMNLIPSASLSGIRNLPLGPSNPPPQAVLTQRHHTPSVDLTIDYHQLLQPTNS